MLQYTNKCNILGVNVSVVNMEETIRFITENLEELKGTYICVSNVHTTIMSYEDKTYCAVQNHAAMVLPDGGPLSKVGKRLGYNTMERVTGPDLMERIFDSPDSKSRRHFFYGATEDTLNSLRQRLLERYPEIKIAGTYSPPFRKMTAEEDEQVIRMINAAGVDFVWVGLGAPKQEQWMWEHQGRIDGLMIGVGAGFDYHAGKIKRAPIWMQKHSLEWLYRLCQEPGRLFMRYFRTNIKFLYLIHKGRKR